MSLFKQVKSSILKECKESDEASLVKVIARFDYYQHCIPTLLELQKAIEAINPIFVERRDGILFFALIDSEESLKADEVEEQDIQKAYDAYMKIMGESNRWLNT